MDRLQSSPHPRFIKYRETVVKVSSFAMPQGWISHQTLVSEQHFLPRHKRARCHQQCVYKKGCKALAKDFKDFKLSHFSKMGCPLGSIIVFVLGSFSLHHSDLRLFCPCTAALFEELLCIFQSVFACHVQAWSSFLMQLVTSMGLHTGYTHGNTQKFMALPMESTI